MPFKSIIVGSYFGEVEIIYKLRRLHTTVAAEETDLLTISKQVYEAIIITNYPEIYEEMKYIAKVRIQKNREAEHFLKATMNSRSISRLQIYKDYLYERKVTKFSEARRRIRSEFETNRTKIKSMSFNDYSKSKAQKYFKRLLSLKDNSNLKIKLCNMKSLQILSSDEYLTISQLKLKEQIESKDIFNKIVQGNIRSQKSCRRSFVLNKILRKTIANHNHNELLEREKGIRNQRCRSKVIASPINLRSFSSELIIPYSKQFKFSVSPKFSVPKSSPNILKSNKLSLIEDKAQPKHLFKGDTVKSNIKSQVEQKSICAEVVDISQKKIYSVIQPTFNLSSKMTPLDYQQLKSLNRLKSITKKIKESLRTLK